MLTTGLNKREGCLFTNWLHVQTMVGPDGKRKEPESNILLASIENMQYAVTVDVLHTVRVNLLCYMFKGYSLNRQLAKHVFMNCLIEFIRN